MMLAAADLGIGTGHSSVGDQERAREILGVPDDHDVAYLIGIGYPADRPLKPIKQAEPPPLRRGRPPRPLVGTRRSTRPFGCYFHRTGRLPSSASASRAAW